MNTNSKRIATLVTVLAGLGLGWTALAPVHASAAPSVREPISTTVLEPAVVTFATPREPLTFSVMRRGTTTPRHELVCSRPDNRLGGSLVTCK